MPYPSPSLYPEVTLLPGSETFPTPDLPNSLELAPTDFTLELAPTAHTLTLAPGSTLTLEKLNHRLELDG